MRHPSSRFFSLHGLSRPSWLRLCQSLVLAGGLAVSLHAHADLHIDTGVQLNVGSGRIDLGCTDLLLTGTLIVPEGGSLVGVRNVHLTSTGVLQVQGGSVEMTQVWQSEGTINAGNGEIARVSGSDECPAVGRVGPNPHLTAVAPQDVTPVPVGGGLVVVLTGLLLAAATAWRRARPRPSSLQR